MKYLSKEQHEKAYAKYRGLYRWGWVVGIGSIFLALLSIALTSKVNIVTYIIAVFGTAFPLYTMGAYAGMLLALGGFCVFADIMYVIFSMDSAPIVMLILLIVGNVAGWSLGTRKYARTHGKDEYGFTSAVLDKGLPAHRSPGPWLALFGRRCEVCGKLYYRSKNAVKCCAVEKENRKKNPPLYGGANGGGDPGFDYVQLGRYMRGDFDYTDRDGRPKGY